MEEVEERLIQEAKRRGFKKGVRFNTVRTPNNTVEVVELLMRNKPNSKEFSLYAKPFGVDGATYTVFESGIWAEIIEEPLTLNGKGVEVDYENNSIHALGNSYEIDDFKDFVCHCNGYDIDTIRKNGEVYLIQDLRELLTKIEENENK